MEEFFFSINSIIKKLREQLSSDTPISEDLFFPLVGDYSKSLKDLLNLYHEPWRTEVEKAFLSPHINYYRQLQNYLIFICRFPTILLVPHHSEILQTLKYIDQKQNLIKDVYEKLSQQEKNLLNGQFKEELERLIGKMR